MGSTTTAAVAGIVVGALLLMIALVIFIVPFARRRSARKRNSSSSAHSVPSGADQEHASVHSTTSSARRNRFLKGHARTPSGADAGVPLLPSLTSSEKLRTGIGAHNSHHRSATADGDEEWETPGSPHAPAPPPTRIPTLSPTHAEGLAEAQDASTPNIAILATSASPTDDSPLAHAQPMLAINIPAPPAAVTPERRGPPSRTSTSFLSLSSPTSSASKGTTGALAIPPPPRSNSSYRTPPSRTSTSQSSSNATTGTATPRSLSLDEHGPMSLPPLRAGPGTMSMAPPPARPPPQRGPSVESTQATIGSPVSLAPTDASNSLSPNTMQVMAGLFPPVPVPAVLQAGPGSASPNSQQGQIQGQQGQILRHTTDRQIVSRAPALEPLVEASSYAGTPSVRPLDLSRTSRTVPSTSNFSSSTSSLGAPTATNTLGLGPPPTNLDPDQGRVSGGKRDDETSSISSAYTLAFSDFANLPAASSRLPSLTHAALAPLSARLHADMGSPVLGRSGDRERDAGGYDDDSPVLGLSLGGGGYRDGNSSMPTIPSLPSQSRSELGSNVGGGGSELSSAPSALTGAFRASVHSPSPPASSLGSSSFSLRRAVPSVSGTAMSSSTQHTNTSGSSSTGTGPSSGYGTEITGSRPVTGFSNFTGLTGTTGTAGTGSTPTHTHSNTYSPNAGMSTPRLGVIAEQGQENVRVLREMMSFASDISASSSRATLGVNSAGAGAGEGYGSRGYTPLGSEPATSMAGSEVGSRSGTSSGGTVLSTPGPANANVTAGVNHTHRSDRSNASTVGSNGSFTTALSTLPNGTQPQPLTSPGISQWGELAPRRPSNASQTFGGIGPGGIPLGAPPAYSSGTGRPLPAPTTPRLGADLSQGHTRSRSGSGAGRPLPSPLGSPKTPGRGLPVVPNTIPPVPPLSLTPGPRGDGQGNALVKPRAQLRPGPAVNEAQVDPASEGERSDLEGGERGREGDESVGLGVGSRPEGARLGMARIPSARGVVEWM